MEENQLLFLEDFLCPHCSHRDHGKFCSNCRGELRIGDNLLIETAARRLEGLGYTRVVAPQDCGPLTQMVVRHLAGTGVVTVAYELPAHRAAEVVLLAESSEDLVATLTEGVQQLAGEFDDVTRAAFDTDGETHISVRLMLFAKPDDQHEQLRSLASGFGGKRQVVRKRRFRMDPEMGRLLWSAEAISTRSGERFDWKARFDVVVHECKMATRQTQEPVVEALARASSATRIIEGLAGEVGNYFVMLWAFARSRFVFADLIVNRGFPPERILSIYIVGIGVSVLLPYVVTFGRVGPAELLTVGELPPIVDELAELTVSLVFLVIQAIFLHVSFRMMGYRGRLVLLVLSFLFVNAFFQIVDRPVAYLRGNLFSPGNVESTSAQVASLVELAKWPAYAYCILPFTALVYRASNKAVMRAFLITIVAGVLAFGVLNRSAGATLRRGSQLNEFNAMLESEKRALSAYATKVVPNLEKNPTTAVSELALVIADIERLGVQLSATRAKAGGVCDEPLGSSCHELANVIAIRLSLFKELEAWLRKNGGAHDPEAAEQIDKLGEQLKGALARLDAANKAAGQP